MIAVLNGQEFEGSILRVHSTGFSYADCRDGDGQYGSHMWRGFNGRSVQKWLEAESRGLMLCAKQRAISKREKTKVCLSQACSRLDRG